MLIRSQYQITIYEQRITDIYPILTKYFTTILCQYIANSISWHSIDLKGNGNMSLEFVLLFD